MMLLASQLLINPAVAVAVFVFALIILTATYKTWRGQTSCRIRGGSVVLNQLGDIVCNTPSCFSYRS